MMSSAMLRRPRSPERHDVLIVKIGLHGMVFWSSGGCKENAI